MNNILAPFDNSRVSRSLLLSSAFINLLSLALPFAMLQIYDRILPNQSHGTATVLVLGVSIAILLELFLRYARSWMLASSAANFELTTTIKSVKALLNAKHSDIEKYGSGKIINGLNSVSSMRDLFSGQAALAFMDIPFVLLFLGLVAYIGGYLVMIPVVVWFIVIALVMSINRKLSNYTRELSMTEAQRSRLLINTLSGLTTAKALALETSCARQYKEINHKRLALQEDVDWLSSKLQEFVQGASQGTTLLLVLLGCLAVLDGNLTTGGLAACSILAGRAVAPLSAIINLRSRLISAKTAMADVDELLSLEQESFSATTCYQQKLPIGPVTFEKLSYANVGGTIHALNGDIRAGDLVCVQSNPLTHASLLLSCIGGFNTPDSGGIRIANVALSEHDRDEFRQSVIYLAPWPTLFAGTVLENMTMFQSQLEPYAMELSQRLGLSATLAQLPSGYQTTVGENDSQNLNKGAVKLIAIIRSIVQSPSILLLDEPMISLDASAQAKLIELLSDLKGSMTIFAASYFEAIEDIADRKIILEKQSARILKQEATEQGAQNGE